MDLNLEKTTRQTTRQTTNFSSTGGDIVYDATVPNFALDATHLSQFYTVTEISLEDRLAVAIAAREDAIHLCREGAFPETTSDYEPMVGTVAPDTISLESYNETTDLTAGLSQLLTNTPETTSGISAADCKAFFEADLPAPSTSTSDVESSKTQSLQGTGIYSNGAEETTSCKPKCFFFIFYPTLFLWAGVLRQTRHRIWFGFGQAPVFHFGYDFRKTSKSSYAWLGINLATNEFFSQNPCPLVA